MTPLALWQKTKSKTFVDSCCTNCRNTVCFTQQRKGLDILKYSNHVVICCGVLRFSITRVWSRTASHPTFCFCFCVYPPFSTVVRSGCGMHARPTGCLQNGALDASKCRGDAFTQAVGTEAFGSLRRYLYRCSNFLRFPPASTRRSGSSPHVRFGPFGRSSD